MCALGKHYFVMSNSHSEALLECRGKIADQLIELQDLWKKQCYRLSLPTSSVTSSVPAAVWTLALALSGDAAKGEWLHLRDFSRSLFSLLIAELEDWASRTPEASTQALVVQTSSVRGSVFSKNEARNKEGVSQLSSVVADVGM